MLNDNLRLAHQRCNDIAVTLSLPFFIPWVFCSSYCNYRLKEHYFSYYCYGIRRSGGHWPNYRACGRGLRRKRPSRGRCQVRTSYVSVRQIVIFLFLKEKKFLHSAERLFLNQLKLYSTWHISSSTFVMHCESILKIQLNMKFGKFVILDTIKIFFSECAM